MLTKFKSVLGSFRRMSSSIKSSLFVPGSIATHVTPTVIPYFNLSERLANKEKVNKMEENLRARNISLEKFNLEKYAESQGYLEWLENGIERCNELRAELTDRIKTAKAEGAKVNEDWGTELSELKKTLAGLNKDKWKLEETIVVEYLNLPNRLHPDTPKGSGAEGGTVIHNFCRDSSAGRDGLLGHQELCADELHFSAVDPTYYLVGSLARLELELMDQASHVLTGLNFEMASCSDFVRSSIVEGCHPNSNLCQEESRSALALAPTTDFGDFASGMGTYLVGSASLYPLVAFMVKNVLTSPGMMPLSYFSCGRRYSVPPPATAGSKSKSLFCCRQASAVELLSGCKDEASAEEQFNHIATIMKEFYARFNVHFRMVAASASDLDYSQSKKVAVQMHSTSENKYVEVANVCLYDDFLSERLMLLYETAEGSDCRSRATHIVGGKFMSAPHLIGCLVENCQTSEGTYDLNHFFV